MNISLNVKERVTLSAALRSKVHKDVQVLLDFRDRAKMFDLTDEEKELVGFQSIKGEAGVGTISYTWKDEEYQKEFTLDRPTARAVIDRIKELATANQLNAASEPHLSIYEKVNDAMNKEAESETTETPS